MRGHLIRFCLCGLLILGLTPTLASDARERLKLAVTTSFENSGLAEILLPQAQDNLSINIDLIVVGSGQAMRLARNGDVDAILVHAPADEIALVNSGAALHRRPIMYNDFILAGPQNDPAGVRNSPDILSAFQRLQENQVLFISRGDDSGTEKREKSLWQEAGLLPHTFASDWYRETGAGMGASLNIASALNAYILVDRGSWLKFGNKGELILLYEGDARLLNQYSFLPVNPNRHPHANFKAASRFENWLVSDQAKTMISTYKIKGAPLFFIAK